MVLKESELTCRHSSLRQSSSRIWWFYIPARVEWSHKACLSRPSDTSFFSARWYLFFVPFLPILVPFLPILSIFFAHFSPFLTYFFIPFRYLFRVGGVWGSQPVADLSIRRQTGCALEWTARVKKVIQESYSRKYFKLLKKGGTRIYYREVNGRFDPVIEALV